MTLQQLRNIQSFSGLNNNLELIDDFLKLKGALKSDVGVYFIHTPDHIP